MTRFMCRYCRRIFEKEEISVLMKGNGNGLFGDWVWIPDNCPVCKKGMDRWYIPEREWTHRWHDAVRYQKNVGRDA